MASWRKTRTNVTISYPVDKLFEIPTLEVTPKSPCDLELKIEVMFGERMLLNIYSISCYPRMD